MSIANGRYEKGHRETKEQKEKRLLNLRKVIVGKNNVHWKGDNAVQHTIHHWIVRWKGRPKQCEVCGTTDAKKYEWSNIDHKYRRVLDDYIRMCTKCHRNYDYDNHLSDKGSRYGSVPNKK